MIDERAELRRALLEFAVEHLTDPVIVLDERGRLVGANRAAIEKSALELVTELDGDGPLAQFWSELRACGRAVAEIPSQKPELRFALEGFQVTHGFVLRMRELDSAPPASETSEQNRRLESLGLLTASIVHDLNNLLAPMLLLTTVLRRSTPEQAPTIAREIESAAAKAISLTRRALAIVRPRQAVVERVNVGEVVRATQSLLERVVGERVEVSVEIGSDVPDALLDRERLEHALLNLAANARDAMPNGGRLTLRVARVAPGTEVSDPDAGEFVSLTVTDTGSGMSEEVRSRLFERFFTTKQETGNGLGLAAVRSFVADTHGLISVWSRPLRGTVVALFFPRAMRAERPTLRAIPKPQGAA